MSSANLTTLRNIAHNFHRTPVALGAFIGFVLSAVIAVNLTEAMGLRVGILVVGVGCGIYLGPVILGLVFLQLIAHRYCPAVRDEVVSTFDRFLSGEDSGDAGLDLQALSNRLCAPQPGRPKE